jgi:hypothetical protein
VPDRCVADWGSACLAQGEKRTCELSGKPASVVVNFFGVPYYYADRQTLELDWNGIKQKIAQVQLAPAPHPPPRAGARLSPLAQRPCRRR